MIPHLPEPSHMADGFTLWHVLGTVSVASLVTMLVTKFWEAIAESIATRLVSPLMKIAFKIVGKEWKGFKKVVKEAVEETTPDVKPPESVHECVSRVEIRDIMSTHRAQTQELGNIIQRAVTEMKDDAKENAKDTKETLKLFELKMNENLSNIHDKVNATTKETSEIKGTVDTIKQMLPLLKG